MASCSGSLSRLARNSVDWQQLLQLCAYTDTLILDEEGIYVSYKERTLVNIGDRDNDGIYDVLDYDFVDESDEVVGWVLDFGIDGQPDQRLYYSKGSSAPAKILMWVDDAWRQRVEKDGVVVVEIDGVWRKVDHVDGRWFLVE